MASGCGSPDEEPEALVGDAPAGDDRPCGSPCDKIRSMGFQPPNSPAAQKLKEFVDQFIPDATLLTDPFIGFRVRGTEFLFKKGENTYHRTKGTEYPVISFAKSVYPLSVPRKPSYIVLWATDSIKSRAVGAIGEKVFLMTVSELESYLNGALGKRFAITLTSPRNRRFLDKEIPLANVRTRLLGVTPPVHGSNV